DTVAGRGVLLLVDQVPVPEGAATVCIESSQRLQLARGSKDFTFRVYEGGTIRGNLIALNEASPQATWPSQAVIRDNGLYRLRGSSDTVDLTLRLLRAGTLARLPQVATIEELDRRGCRAQVERALQQSIWGRG